MKTNQSYPIDLPTRILVCTPEEAIQLSRAGEDTALRDRIIAKLFGRQTARRLVGERLSITVIDEPRKGERLFNVDTNLPDR